MYCLTKYAGDINMKQATEQGKRQIRMAANRQRIIETAKELFKVNGYEQTTMNDIIENSGLSNGTIYNLYPAKKDILFDIYMTYVNVPLHLNDDYENKVLYPAESILAFCEEYIKLWLGVGWSVAMNIYHAYSAKDSLNDNAQREAFFENQLVKLELREFIEHAQSAGTMTTAYRASEIETIISTHERGMLYLWGLSKGEYDFAAEARK